MTRKNEVEPMHMDMMIGLDATIGMACFSLRRDTPNETVTPSQEKHHIHIHIHDHRPKAPVSCEALGLAQTQVYT